MQMFQPSPEFLENLWIRILLREVTAVQVRHAALLANLQRHFQQKVDDSVFSTRSGMHPAIAIDLSVRNSGQTRSYLYRLKKQIPFLLSFPPLMPAFRQNISSVNH